jgi:hypothetical protein
VVSSCKRHASARKPCLAMSLDGELPKPRRTRVHYDSWKMPDEGKMLVPPLALPPSWTGTALEHQVAALNDEVDHGQKRLDFDADHDEMVERIATKLEHLHALIKDMKNLELRTQILDEFDLFE